MLKYLQYVKNIKEGDSFDSYKDDITKKLLSQQQTDDKPIEKTKTKQDIETDNTIVVSVKKEIESYEQKKTLIKNKIKKLEELMSGGDFSQENKKRIEAEKKTLQEELKDFDNLIKASTDKLKLLKK